MAAEQFSYTPEYQAKIISLMLCSPNFCGLAADALQGENFGSPVLRWFFDKIAEAETPLTPATLKEELLKTAANNVIKESEVKTYVELYTEIKQRPNKHDEDHIYKSLSEFVRHQNVKKAFQESLLLLKEGNWETIVDKITQAATTQLQPLSLGHNFLVDYQTRLAARMAETESFIMPTGIPELDPLLGGGLEAEQLGLIVGGTGRGKSVFLAHLARHALLLNHSVVYYTLELSEAIMARRLDSMFTHFRPVELKQKNADVFHKMEKLHAQYKQSLIIKGFPTGQASVRTLRTHYRQLLAAGITPKLICVDYLDLLKSQRQYKDYRFELDDITKALRGLSQEFGVPVWTATQMNRAGMAAETPDESSISEAVNKLFTVDVCIFMAQTKAEREDELMRLFLSKNRNGPSGYQVKITTDYAYLTFLRKMAAPEIVDSSTLDLTGQT